MVTKKDFITVGSHLNHYFALEETFTARGILDTLCDAFKEINPKFDRERWVGYTLGKCGPNGGKVKQ